MSKYITHAGTSRVDGVLKFRTATDQKRISHLKRLKSHTEINLVELQPPAFDKADAVKTLLAMGFGEGDAEVLALLTSMVRDENPFVKPVKAKAKKEAVVKVKVSKVRKANEPRELSAKELAAAQFIVFPVGDSGRAYYPAPKAAVEIDDVEAV